MAILTEETTSIRIVDTVDGGKTYYVMSPRWPGEERAICYRRSRHANENGELDVNRRCAKVAGWGTPHLGIGACRTHGGNNYKPVTNGSTAQVQQSRMKDMINDYLKGDRTLLMDLTKELAAVKVLFDTAIEQFPDVSEVDPTEYEWATKKLIHLVGTLAELVDKVSRVEARQTITTTQVLYLRACIADLMAKYITEPNQRNEALKELTSRIGGGNLELAVLGDGAPVHVPRDRKQIKSRSNAIQ